MRLAPVQINTTANGLKSHAGRLTTAAALLFACLAALAVPAPAQEGRRLTDRIVAWVDDAAITLTEVEETRAQYQAEGILPPDGKTTESLRAALNLLVDNSLMLAAAKKTGIEVPAEFLDNRSESTLKALENKYGGSEAFDESLKKTGMTRDTFREQMREHLRREWIIARAVNSRFAVSNDDVERFERDRAGKGFPTARYQLAHLFLPVPASAPAERWEAARQALLEGKKALASEKNVPRAAAEYAALHRAERMDGGPLGLMDTTELQPELAAALEKMEPGKFSEPIRSPRGMHLLYLAGKTSAREILIAKRYDEAREKWLAELRKNAHIEILEFK